MTLAAYLCMSVCGLTSDEAANWQKVNKQNAAAKRQLLNCCCFCYCCNASSQQQPNAEAARSKNQKHFFISSHPIRIPCTCAFFMSVWVCARVWVRVYVCLYVWVVLFALACGLLLSLLPPLCSGFRFTRQQSALPLPLPLLRPRPLLPPLLLLPSYSCVAFFLTFAEFIDIFSICFCALLSLSERALSLFLPLSLSLSRSFAHSLTHTQTLVFFCCFL